MLRLSGQNATVEEFLYRICYFISQKALEKTQFNAFGYIGRNDKPE